MTKPSRTGTDISFFSTTTASSYESASYTIPSASDRVIWVFGGVRRNSGDGTISSVVFDAGGPNETTLTIISEVDNDGTVRVRGFIARGIAPPVASGTITVTCTSNVQDCGFHVTTMQDTHQTDPDGTPVSRADQDNSQSVPLNETTTDLGLAVMVIRGDKTGSITADGDDTKLSAVGGGDLTVQFQEDPTIDDDTMNASWTTGAKNVMIGVGVLEAAAPIGGFAHSQAVIVG